MRRRDAQIARERELEPPAERGAVDGGDDWFGRPIDGKKLASIELELSSHRVFVHRLSLL